MQFCDSHFLRNFSFRQQTKTKAKLGSMVVANHITDYTFEVANNKHKQPQQPRRTSHNKSLTPAQGRLQPSKIRTTSCSFLAYLFVSTTATS